MHATTQIFLWSDFKGKVFIKPPLGKKIISSISSVFQEFKKFCGNLSMEQVNAAFKAFDISGDNQLDYDEFCKLMNNR